jgi:hypothetical protein
LALRHRQLVRRVSRRGYILNICRQARDRDRIGFTSLSQAFEFLRAVTNGTHHGGGGCRRRSRGVRQPV